MFNVSIKCAFRFVLSCYCNSAFLKKIPDHLIHESQHSPRILKMTESSSADEITTDQEDEEINCLLSKEEREKYEDIKKLPMQAELKRLEKRFTSKGTAYIVEPLVEEEEEEEIPEQTNWWEKFALCVTDHYNRDNTYILNRSLQVNASSLKELLKDVIGDYPGLSFCHRDISVPFPCRPLFLYRQDLEEVGTRRFENDAESAAYLKLLLDFIRSHFNDELTEGKYLLDQGLITFKYLWTIFRPGTTVFRHAWPAKSIRTH